MATVTSPILSPASAVSDWSEGKKLQHSPWRHTLGILLLLVTVVLWTASNFLASTIFADNTYSKPFFVTYTNTAFFVLPLVPLLFKQLYSDRSHIPSWRELLRRRVGRYELIKDLDEEEDPSWKPQSPRLERRRSSSISRDLGVRDAIGNSHLNLGSSRRLTLLETAKLSLEFSMIWFVANYFTASCLQYTTVASSTILTSTSSMWTLIIGALVHVEHFTIKKFLGVLASLAGIVLISTVDMSGNNDENRGSFPHKTQGEIALGDAMAFISAILYGCYSVLMKKRMGDEGHVNMPLFFGLVGLFNVILLWPGFIILHFTGVETFELPPTGRILAIVLVNSTSSLISDFCWAYAIMLTSPLVVTVGLSITIPLSLIGQIILQSQYSSFTYWFGAGIVFLSFIFVNHEEAKEEIEATHAVVDSAHGA